MPDLTPWTPLITFVLCIVGIIWMVWFAQTKDEKRLGDENTEVGRIRCYVGSAYVKHPPSWVCLGHDRVGPGWVEFALFGQPFSMTADDAFNFTEALRQDCQASSQAKRRGAS